MSPPPDNRHAKRAAKHLAKRQAEAQKRMVMKMIKRNHRLRKARSRELDGVSLEILTD